MQRKDTEKMLPEKGGIKMSRAMNWYVWEKKFQPIKNKLDKNASIDGYMFETYGKEVAAVKKQIEKDHNTVWTVIDGMNRKTYAIPGWHFVNRLGYFITKVPYENEEMSVLI